VGAALISRSAVGCINLDAGENSIVGAASDANRSAAHEAVLNVNLLGNGQIDDEGYCFPAIRAVDIRFVDQRAQRMIL